MAQSRPFAYNPGASIPGTEQVGDLSIGAPISGFTNNPQYWNGPDEELGYVIAQSVSGNTQPTPIPGVFASVGFFQTSGFSDSEFINLSQVVSSEYGTPQTFSSATDASTWLTTNGFWNSYISPTPTLTPTPTPTVTETPTGTPSETPTNTPTPTSTDLSSVTTFTISGCTNLNVLVADLGPSSLAPGDVFNFTFTGGTPNGCYRIVEKTVATPTDGATPLLFYVNCAACQASLVTPTPTTTSTPTPSVTNTQTPSVTPTLTPTPSVTPEPVTGYSFNLVALPYNFPSSGNTIMNGPGGATSGSTNPNELTTSARGIYWNSIDTDGIDRTNYFSQFTGQSVTITMTQTGSTAIYSGDSQSLKSWSQSPSTGFVFGTNIQIPPLTAATGNAVIIQSASTQWTIGLPVYISVVNNNPSVTPTPTATSVTPTPTPTSGSTGVGWFFYSPDNTIVSAPPINNGNTTFIPTGGIGTYNPNYTGGTLSLFFNKNNSAGTSYESQFSGLDTSGGTITISQGSSVAIYSGTSTDYNLAPTYLQLLVNNSVQMIQSASTPFVSGTSINVVVS